MPTAILVDGAFFLRRLRALNGPMTPPDVADKLVTMCHWHLSSKKSSQKIPLEKSRLYRIFYYDCPPLMKKAHHPLTGKSIDFSKTEVAIWRLELFEQLKKKRKIALRLGEILAGQAQWRIKPDMVKQLLSRKIDISELTESNVQYDASQKGVDMRIGLDIASLAYKKHVDQIILVAGDSDFVPAAKLARREGIDFILDPMWAPIRPDLHEHIDGLRSVLSKPPRSDSQAATENL